MDAKTRFTEFVEKLEVSKIQHEKLKTQLDLMKKLYNQGIPSDDLIDTQSDYYFDKEANYPITRADYLMEDNNSLSKDFEEFLNEQNSHVRNVENEINKWNFKIEETIAESERTNSKKSLRSSTSRELELENQKFDEEKIINSDCELNSPRMIISTRKNFDQEKCSLLTRAGSNLNEILTGKEEETEKNVNQEENETGDKTKMKIEIRMKDEIKIKDEKKIKIPPTMHEKMRLIKKNIQNKFTTENSINIRKSPKSNDENQFNDERNKISDKFQKSANGTEKDNFKKNKLTDQLLLKFCQSVDGVGKIVKRKSNFNNNSNKYEKKMQKQKTGQKSLLPINKRSSAKLNESAMTIGKIKKKRGKLRSFSSKSTIATKRDSNNLVQNNLTKKERKRRKEKMQKNGIARSSSLQNSKEKFEENFNDLVEIYHNTALKTGSMSVVSSKHSRMNPHFHEESIHEISPRKKLDIDETTEIQPKKTLLPIVDVLTKEKLTFDGSKEENILSKNEVKYLHSYPGNKFYDPILMRNYEQPTVASKLKRVQRSYYNRFNFRNIPFTVGTSISPSHNLGLNIQQVLSIMKSKQARPQGVSSELIRKMSQGNRPMTNLSTEMNSQLGLNFVNLPLKKSTLNCRTSQISSSNKMSNLQQQPNFNTRNICETLFEDKEIELNIEDKNPIKQTNRDVLIKLHDQLEEMNLKYEKLQEKSEKCKDKLISKEIEKLEVDLAAKEEEINAVIGLYNEVMTLKKQMKRMSEKNSFVCMSSETSNQSPIINYAHNPMIRAYLSPKLQIKKNRGGNNYRREPSTGTRLTGLLRQIQMFQWQLKQASL